MTGSNGLKRCLKTAKSLLCGAGEPSVLQSSTLSLQGPEGKLTHEWNEQTGICISTISELLGTMSWRKLWAHISLKAELLSRFQKENKPIFTWKLLKYLSVLKGF